MKPRFVVSKMGYIIFVALVLMGVAAAQIQVDSARIGCLDIQKTGNLTAMVASACNNKTFCSFQAPTPEQYLRAGVMASTRSMCSQAMEITYNCRNDQIVVTVDGDAWTRHPAELTCEPLQPLPQPQPPGARLRGWVDLHTHPLSNLGFGGKLVYGGVDIGSQLPADPDCHHNVRAGSLDQALGHDSSTHGGNNYAPSTQPQCTDDIRKLVIHAVQGDFTSVGDAVTGHMFTMSEDAHGAPDFKDWPRWDDLTHQKMWVDWIRRAYNSGQRVMVALAVNNKTLADAVSGPGDGPQDDSGSADVQIAATIAFVGRHPDFMEIAKTSADLERIVRANKLAVVLGVEIDNIGDLKGTPTNDQISAEIDHLYSQGVRYIFPIHLLDNPFGGTAAYEDLFNFSTFREEGHYWNLGCAPQPLPGNQFSEVINYRFGSLNKFLPPLLDVAAPKLGMTWALLPGYPNCGQTNQQGLTAQGVFAINWMMHKGMFIDVDHMSDNSRSQAISIAESVSRNGITGYPLNSGHNGLRGFIPDSDGISADPPGPNQINERSTSFSQYRQIAQLHGMVGIGSDSLNAYQWVNMYRHVLAAMGNGAGSSTGAIGAFGTDLNGLAKGMPPNVAQNNTVANPQYLKCVKGFQCAASADNTVRRPGQPVTNACAANAQASCLKQFPATLVECVSNCGHPRVEYTNAFPMSALGTSLGIYSWDYNVVGVAHYGMLADFLQDASKAPAPGTPSGVKYVSAMGPPVPLTGVNLINNNFMFGADYFLQTWKRVEALSNRLLNVSVVPTSVQPGVSTTILIKALDPQTGQPAPRAMVQIGNGVVPAGQPFKYIFHCTAVGSTQRSTRLNTIKEPPDFPNPSFTVTAPGFVDNSVEFTMIGIKPGQSCH